MELDRDGYNYIYVERDIMTNMVMLRALKDKNMETIARQHLSICGDYGFVRILQSDNEREWVNQLMIVFVVN